MSDAHNTPDRLHATAVPVDIQPAPHLVAESTAPGHIASDEREVTVGDIKTLLAAFANRPAPAGSADLAGDLRRLYDLLCAQAVAHGVDPARAMRLESAYADSHRPHLVPDHEPKAG